MHRAVRALAAQAAIFPRRLYWYARRRVGAARIRSTRRLVARGSALDGKTAVVTGAGRGIGLAIAGAFARAGAHCVLVDIDRDAGARAASDLLTRGLSAEFCGADVGDPGQMRELADDIARRHSKVDILVNNAAVQLDEDLQMHAAAMDAAVTQRTLAVNLYGVLHSCAAFAPLIPSGGRIINVSSTRGQLSQRSDGYAPAYRLSKAALSSYTQSLAADLRPRGVLVDCFHPGWVRTAIGGPNATLGPDDVTDTAMFLATRQPRNGSTGLFWWDCQTIRW